MAFSTLGTRGNSLAKSGRPKAGETSVRSEVSEVSGPHTRFAGQWPAGFSKRVASGTQGSHTNEIAIFPPFRRWPDVNKSYFKLSLIFLKFLKH